MTFAPNNAPGSRLNETRALLILTLALFSFKALWISSTPGPMVFFDELFYKTNAHSFFNHLPYQYVIYPPLYPLALSPALLSDLWYQWMLLINAFCSSLLVPATWFLGRSLQLRHPIYPAVLSALLPFHIVFPRLLMSENLFMPLFACSLALALKGNNGRIARGCLFGAALAFSHLAKYLFLPSVPLLFIFWNIPSGAKRYGKISRIASAGAALLAYGAIFGAWLWYGHENGFSWNRLLGLNFLNSRPEGASIDAFMMWAAAYAAYIVLMGIPTWFLAASWIGQLTKKHWRARITTGHIRFIVLIALLIGGYGFTACLHSFGAGYNYPKAQYIIGRYLMQLSPIILVFFVWLSERINENHDSFQISRAIPGNLFVAALVLCAWGVLYRKAIWPFPSWFANIPINSVDIFANFYPVIFFSVLCLSSSLMLIASHFKTRPKALPAVFIAVLILYLAPTYLRIEKAQQPLHAREFATIIGEIPGASKTLMHIFADRRIPAASLVRGLAFWGIPEEQIRMETSWPPVEFPSDEPAFLISSKRCPAPALKQYTVNGIDYRIYRSDTLDHETILSLIQN